ncbi:hypothetical protein B0H19DRAFT_1269281 [Mycena capillaripes]|nr:hypothetical protein B0H19DRAFT_1269281 [Mycena capillaripes]
MAVEGGEKSKGLTTGYKRCRVQFIRHYLARLAEGTHAVKGEFQVGVSCMSPGGGLGIEGWQEMPKGDATDWAILDAALSLRAVMMVTRLELLHNTDIFLELRELDPMIRMA